MSPFSHIHLFGGVQLQQGENTITRFRTKKTAELLAYLAYYRTRTHPREILIDLLWPESDMEAGRHNLSMALSSLRSLLEPPGQVPEGSLLVSDRFMVGLNRANVTTDVAAFESLFKSLKQKLEPSHQIQALSQAVELYKGELLSGYYSDWIFPEQQRLEELYFDALRQLTVLLENAGEIDAALRYALQRLPPHGPRRKPCGAVGDSPSNRFLGQSARGQSQLPPLSAPRGLDCPAPPSCLGNG